MTVSIQHIPHRVFQFPGGEVQVELGAPEARIEDVNVRAQLQTPADIMELLLVTDALRRKFIAPPISLTLPYVPYARQDRVANRGEAHALHVFAALINAQDYLQVLVLDPHSDVVEAVIDRVRIISNVGMVHTMITQKKIHMDRWTLVAPDIGAAKKTQKLARDLFNQPGRSLTTKGGHHPTVVQANKCRDTTTGKLTGFEVFADDLGRAPCVVVDDICDGGGTFLGLAGALKDKNAGPLHLVVSHGIFSQGFDKLREHYDTITYSDSFKRHADHDGVQCLHVI